MKRIHTESLCRRSFLSVSVGSAGVLLSCKFFRKKRSSLSSKASEPPKGLTPWIQIKSNNRVAVLCDKAEMGQGAMTLFAGIVAEELALSIDLIDVEFAPTAEQYGNTKILIPVFALKAPVYAQLTGLSSSTADAWAKLRPSAAGVRLALCAQAAREWNVPASQCTLKDGSVFHPNGQTKAELTHLAHSLANINPGTQKDLKVKFDILGKKPPSNGEGPGKNSAFRRVDAMSKVTGQGVYGIDISARVIGADKLYTAVVVRAPQILATVEGMNLDFVRSLPGVAAVFPILHNRGIAIVADSFWKAQTAAKQLVVRVVDGPNAQFSSDNVVADYVQMLENGKSATRTPFEISIWTDQKLNVGQTSGTKKVSTYIVPYAPHATMEPMNATVWLRDGIWHLWAPTQFPEAAQAAVAREVGVKESAVEVHTTLVGGGFGRRMVADFVSEAAAICKGFEGKPVKLIWTREDDFLHDYFRPIAVHKIEARADSSGIVAWRQQIATQSINAFVTVDYVSSIVPDRLKNAKLVGLFARIGTRILDSVAADPFSVEGSFESAYDFGAFSLTSVQYKPNEVPKIPVGFWRSVGHLHSAFAIESMIEELAHANGLDSVNLRLQALHKSPRAQNVLRRVVSFSGYSAGFSGPGDCMGIATHSGWGSHAAMVVQLNVNPNTFQIKLKKVWAVVDCGFALQPDMIKAQVEGGIVFALSSALKHDITIRNGEVQQSNFHTCDMLRMHECPLIFTEVVENDISVSPTGVGELPVPPVAPAVAAAIFHAVGKRVHRMPFTPENIRAALTLLLFLFCASIWSHTAAAQSSSVSSGGKFKSGPEAFQYLHSVATHPRCVNCHGRIENGKHIPTIGDNSVPHPMNIQAQLEELGHKCTSCHQDKNFSALGFPPGAANDRMPGFLWHMPPAPPVMELRRNLTRQELCLIWTNPNLNSRTPGGRGSLTDLKTFRKEFMHHVQDDPLVHWAFNPGPGRSPAPGNVATLVSAMDTWISWLEMGNTCAGL